MEQNFYEHHTYKEHDLPIIFNQLETKYKRFYSLFYEWASPGGFQRQGNNRRRVGHCCD